MSGRVWAAWSLAIALAGSMPCGAGRADDLKIAWAVGALTGPEKARQSVSVTGEVTLKSGDELKIFIHQISPSFVYLLHEDQKSEIELLYPEGKAPAAASSGSHYIPPEPDWLQLDDGVGIERLYIVASSTRLTGLEQLLDEYRAGTAAAHADVRKRIVAELARLEKQHASPPWSERPVTMGGQIRGPRGRPDVANHATEVTAPGYFAKVLVIDHRKAATQSPKR
jgi:uncharacterized protein DUF4384